MIASEEAEAPPRGGRGVVALVVLAVVAVGAYFALGMPGMGHSGSSGTMAGMEQPADEPMVLAPAAFAERLDDEGVFVVNVHVPAGDEIAGTDATIPYDSIVGDDRLPADQATPILLYCRTGRMSASAGRDLLAAGYTEVAHLDGGMEAWVDAGFELVAT